MSYKEKRAQLNERAERDAKIRMLVRDYQYSMGELGDLILDSSGEEQRIYCTLYMIVRKLEEL